MSSAIRQPSEELTVQTFVRQSGGGAFSGDRQPAGQLTIECQRISCLIWHSTNVQNTGTEEVLRAIRTAPLNTVGLRYWQKVIVAQVWPPIDWCAATAAGT
jgi:hypothetical protein